MTTPVGAPWRGQAHHLLTRAVGYADGVLGAVTPQLLSRPTPCRAWNLRMLLEHAEESLAILHEGVTAHQIAAGPAAAGPAAAPACQVSAASSAAALVSAFRWRAAALLYASAPADGDLPVTVGGAPMPLDCLRTAGALEIAVHAWDISQACSQRVPVPGELATDLLAQAPLLVPVLGRHPLFAAPVPAPPRSTSSDCLTAYLGRPVPDADPRWLRGARHDTHAARSTAAAPPYSLARELVRERRDDGVTGLELAAAATPWGE